MCLRNWLCEACAVPCVLWHGPEARVPGTGPAESRRGHTAFSQACSSRPAVRHRRLRCRLRDRDPGDDVPRVNQAHPIPTLVPRSLVKAAVTVATSDRFRNGTGGLRKMLGGWMGAGIWGSPQRWGRICSRVLSLACAGKVAPVCWAALPMCRGGRCGTERHPRLEPSHWL